MDKIINLQAYKNCKHQRKYAAKLTIVKYQDENVKPKRNSENKENVKKFTEMHGGRIFVFLGNKYVNYSF